MTRWKVCDGGGGWGLGHGQKKKKKKIEEEEGEEEEEEEEEERMGVGWMCFNKTGEQMSLYTFGVETSQNHTSEVARYWSNNNNNNNSSSSSSSKNNFKLKQKSLTEYSRARC